MKRLISYRLEEPEARHLDALERLDDHDRLVGADLPAIVAELRRAHPDQGDTHKSAASVLEGLRLQGRVHEEPAGTYHAMPSTQSAYRDRTTDLNWIPAGFHPDGTVTIERLDISGANRTRVSLADFHRRFIRIRW